MNQPKYQLIAADIKKKILSGTYAFNTTIPPELQLQKNFSVSRYTVREAIALLVNEGYLRKEKGSGTYVDDQYKQAAVNIGVNQLKTIGVITTYLSDYIFPSIIRGIEKTLSSQGYSLLLASTNNDYRQEKECLEKMIDHGVQGLIVEPTKSNQYNPNLAMYVNLREQKIPLVMINAAYEELNVPSICVDDVKGGYLATEYLIKNNHKQLLFITKIDDLQGKYRMKGFIKACEKYDIHFSSDDVITYTTETRKRVITESLHRLRQRKEITGIVCYNDQIANRLITEMIKQGAEIPIDFSIIGNDDSSLSENGKVQLTTLKHPKEQLGIDAANWVLQTIENGRPENSVLYSPILVERNSVRAIK